MRNLTRTAVATTTINMSMMLTRLENCSAMVLVFDPAIETIEWYDLLVKMNILG
jgi:hypothetical protein